MEIKFAKMNASGNDFIVIDNREGFFKSGLNGLSKRLCERKISVGADGLLVIEKSAKADFGLKIFNPDGSRAQMCGNGSRCAARYAFSEGLAGSKMRIETLAGIIEASVSGGRVRVKLSDPVDMKLDFSIVLEGAGQKVSFINTGVPHAVIFVEKDIDGVDVEGKGRLIRYHPAFKPQGTNVDFVRIKGRDSISVRTYERGVEGETLSCGTGSVASAIIGGIQFGLKTPVKVLTRGGETLKVDYSIKAGKPVSGVYLEGGAEEVFRGSLNKGKKRR